MSLTCGCRRRRCGRWRGTEPEQGVVGVDARPAEQAAGVGLEPAVDAGQVEGVAAAREEAEVVGVVEAGEAHGALHPLARPAQRGEAEEGQRLDHRLGDAAPRHIITGRGGSWDRSGQGRGGRVAELGVHEEEEGEGENHGEDANHDGHAGAERDLDAGARRALGSGLGGGRLRDRGARRRGDEDRDKREELARQRHGMGGRRTTSKRPGDSQLSLARALLKVCAGAAQPWWEWVRMISWPGSCGVRTRGGRKSRGREKTSRKKEARGAGD